MKADLKANGAARLYTPTLLALAVELAAFPRDPAQALQGRSKSRTCGSEVLLSGALSADGAIKQIGMEVSACAVGQASAAIFAAAAPGMDAAAINAKLEAMGDWLRGDAPHSILPRLELLEAARAYPARHEAILLPWRAAAAALSSQPNCG